MRAGALRHEITVQQATTTRDSFGAEVQTWVDFATVRAEKKHQSAREFFAAQKINAETTDLFIIRYKSGITAKMRVVFGTMTYGIIGAPDPDGRQRELHLMCKAII